MLMTPFQAMGKRGLDLHRFHVNGMKIAEAAAGTLKGWHIRFSFLARLTLQIA